jgi:hypothetical protein
VLCFQTLRPEFAAAWVASLCAAVERTVASGVHDASVLLHEVATLQRLYARSPLLLVVLAMAARERQVMEGPLGARVHARLGVSRN